MCQLRWAVKHGKTIAMTDGPISPNAIDKSMLSKSVTTFQQKSPLTFLTRFTLGFYFKPRIYPIFFGRMLSNTANRINQHQPSTHVKEGLLGQETIDGGERGQ